MNPTFWIAKDAAGVIRGGLLDDANPNAWTCELSPHGWKRVPGSSAPPMALDDAGEALCALVGKCHEAGLHNFSVDGGDQWPNAPGPWRIEATYRVLWPDDASVSEIECEPYLIATARPRPCRHCGAEWPTIQEPGTDAFICRKCRKVLA